MCPSTFSERMARNTQLLLLEESHLGRVHDPGAGSWYVESLTAAVAASAWEFLQDIEAPVDTAPLWNRGLLTERDRGDEGRAANPISRTAAPRSRA